MQSWMRNPPPLHFCLASSSMFSYTICRGSCSFLELVPWACIMSLGSQRRAFMGVLAEGSISNPPLLSHYIPPVEQSAPSLLLLTASTPSSSCLSLQLSFQYCGFKLGVSGPTGPLLFHSLSSYLDRATGNVRRAATDFASTLGTLLHVQTFKTGSKPAYSLRVVTSRR